MAENKEYVTPAPAPATEPTPESETLPMTKPATATPQSGFAFPCSLSSSSQQILKIRGRMGKFRPHESSGALQSPELTVTPLPSGDASFQALHSAGSSTSPPAKKARGCRPSQPASARKPRIKAPIGGLGSLRPGLASCVIYIKPGEDVYSNILSFSQNGSVCILSASGAVSHATIQQTTIFEGTVTYEGYFQIISLVGSYAMSEFAGQHCKTGGLSITISGGGGRVIGGSVAGPLRAATPVQVVLGNFGGDANEKAGISGADANEKPGQSWC